MASSDLASYQLQLQQVSSFHRTIGICLIDKITLVSFHPLVIMSSLSSIQVEAALTADPENSELLTLKADLEQVIELTKELVSTEAGESTQESNKHDNSLYESSNNELEYLDHHNNAEEEKEIAGNKRKYNLEEIEDVRQPIKHWQVGEECQALSHKDGQ